MDTIETRERRLRRLLARYSLRLHKTPARSWLRKEYGVGYQISEFNTVRFGCGYRQYQGTLEQAEAFAAEVVSQRKAATAG